MRLRDRPWKLLVSAILLTLIWVGCVWHFLHEGEIHLRNLGTVSLTGTPVRLGIYAVAMLAFAGVVVMCWIGVRDEWNRDYRPRWKPEFEDSDNQRSM